MDKVVSNDIVTATARHQIVRYTSVASMTILVTDWMLLFSEELKYIWRRKWKFPEGLYLFTRYMPFVNVSISLTYYLSPTISPHTCLINYATGTWLLVVGFAAAELILVWRTYAIWEKSKRVWWIVSVVWTVLLLVNVPILTIFTRSLEFGPPPLPQIPGCNLVNASNIAFGSFLSVLLTEIMVVVLTIYKGISDVRNSSSTLVLTLYRDGILYFICLLVMSLGNVLVIVAAPVEFFDLLINLTRVLHASLCCRVILHLRQAAHASVGTTRSVREREPAFTTLRFKARRRLRRTGESVEMSTVRESTVHSV